ncbi:uncharacterized protein LOC117225316 [Megalopta genalis]|uniref:uncharacterized protein LOC117225316 n=1 Tax=Megalopta genalis TaxID=115081 RepID=UPI003FD5521A
MEWMLFVEANEESRARLVRQPQQHLLARIRDTGLIKFHSLSDSATRPGRPAAIVTGMASSVVDFQLGETCSQFSDDEQHAEEFVNAIVHYSDVSPFYLLDTRKRELRNERTTHF